MQCEILIKKVLERDKNNAGPTFLKAYLINTILNKLTKLLINYKEIFEPLKEIIMNCLFHEYKINEKANNEFNGIPYFSISNFFSQKVFLLFIIQSHEHLLKKNKIYYVKFPYLKINRKLLKILQAIFHNCIF